MATRARILADYVSGGTTAAEFDYMDGVTSNVQTQMDAKAPTAGPTFTGTVAIPNVANLETAVVANTAKVTNYNQTLADINALDITELGTVTSANLANTAIVYPDGHVINTWIWGDIYTENSSLDVSIGVTWHKVDFGGSYGNMEITGITATQGNKLFITCNPGEVRTDGDGTYTTGVGLRIDATDYSCLNVWFNQTYLIGNGKFNMIFDVPASFSNKTIGLWAGRQGSALGSAKFYTQNTVQSNRPLSLIVQEIQQ